MNAGGPTRGRESAADRLRRLLVMLPWVIERGGASVDEVSEAFGISPDQVIAELGLAQCCGAPPYEFDDMIGIVVLDDEILVEPGAADFFGRPLRLNAAEGFALLAAGRALLAVPGADDHGPLASALDKLEASLGERVPVQVDLDHPEHLPALQSAIEAGERVEIDYYTASRDELSTRRIDPRTVFATEGHWYVDAHCHLAGGSRRFRVDRIEDLRPTGESFESASPESAPAVAYAPGPEATVVRLSLPASAHWIVETYPTAAVEVDAKTGRIDVTLAVTGRPWLERLLLRVGPEARVLSPAEFGDAASGAAQRILARYA